MEKPKSGAAGGGSHTKRQGDVFPLHERPGPHGPPDVALPVMGMSPKGIGGTIRSASSSPFSGMPCASSQKPLSEAWAVLRVKEEAYGTVPA